MENKGESDRCLEILENLEILEISSSEMTPFVMTPFSAPDIRCQNMSGTECTAVTAIQLRMRMRILTRPENSLANFNHQTTTKSCELSVAKEFASECECFLRMKREIFVLAADQTPCEWKFETKFASECECDGLVHSGQADLHGGTLKRDI